MMTREHFEKVTDVVVGELERGNLHVCVVSAISGVTDSLVEAVNRVKNDGGFDTHARAGSGTLSVVNVIFSRLLPLRSVFRAVFHLFFPVFLVWSVIIFISCAN